MLAYTGAAFEQLLSTEQLSSQHLALIYLANMTFQTRSFGDKTFNAVGYGVMGLSFAYGTVGTDEERLKVVNRYVPDHSGSWLTLVCTTGSRCRLRIWVYLLGHRRHVWRQRRFACKMVCIPSP